VIKEKITKVDLIRIYESLIINWITIHYLFFVLILIVFSFIHYFTFIPITETNFNSLKISLNRLGKKVYPSCASSLIQCFSFLLVWS